MNSVNESLKRSIRSSANNSVRIFVWSPVCDSTGASIEAPAWFSGYKSVWSFVRDSVTVSVTGSVNQKLQEYNFSG